MSAAVVGGVRRVGVSDPDTGLVQGSIDGCVLAAASRIEQAVAGLDPDLLRAAREGLCDFPAVAADPRLPGPVLVTRCVSHRRVQAVLTAAGGAGLDDAAARLAVWAGPVVPREELAGLLAGWLPAGQVSGLAAALTRRLLCDTAALAATEGSGLVVAVDALAGFARDARDAADDAGLIDEYTLTRAAAERGLADAFEDLAGACGFVRLFGHLAIPGTSVGHAHRRQRVVSLPVDRP